MSNSNSDSGNRLRWGLRRFWFVPVLAMTTGACLGSVTARQTATDYEATALVVAKTLQISPMALPRFGSVIFDSGEIARQVVQQEQLTTSPAVVQKKLSLTPVQDSILFEVTAQSSTASGAANLANEATDIFVAEINKPGRGIGQFAVQQAATAPAAPLASLDTRTRTVLGILAGLLAGFSLLALFVLVRQPVVTPATAVAMTGAPYVGSLMLRGRYLSGGHRSGSGLTATATRLLAALSGDRSLVAIHGAGGSCLDVAEALADGVVLARREAAAITARAHSDTRLREVRDDVDAEVLVVDAAEADAACHLAIVRKDVREGSAESVDGVAWYRLVVVSEGVPSARVQSMVEQLPAQPDGVVLLRRRPRLRRGWRAPVRSVREQAAGTAISPSPEQTSADANRLTGASGSS